MVTEEEMRLVLSKLAQMNQEQIGRVEEGLRQWRKCAYPDWESAYIALPLRDPEQRRKILEAAVRMLQETDEPAPRQSTG